MRSDTASMNQPKRQYLAHVRQANDESFVIHHLEDHLRAVADLKGAEHW
jgi:hypothetical protein